MTAESITTFSDEEKRILNTLQPSESQGMWLIEDFNAIVYNGPCRLVDTIRNLIWERSTRVISHLK